MFWKKQSSDSCDDDDDDDINVLGQDDIPNITDESKEYVYLYIFICFENLLFILTLLHKCK